MLQNFLGGILFDLLGLIGTVRYKVLPFLAYLLLLFGPPILAIVAIAQTLTR